MNIELYSENGLRKSIMESLPTMIWECSVNPDTSEMKLEYVNNYVTKMLKYSVEEFLSVDDFFSQILHTDEKTIIPNRIKELVKSAKDDTIEFRWIAKDGSTVWTESHFMILYNGTNTPTGIRVISLDVTKSKIVEQEICSRVRQHAAISLLGTKALEGTSTINLMEEAVLLVKDVLQCEYVKVLELLPQENLFVLRAAAGWQKELIGNARVGTGNDSEAGYALLTDEPVIINDLRTEKRFTKQALLFDNNVISGMSVVIKGHIKHYGVISVHTTQKRYFNEDDSNFLKAISNIIATAIERKRAESDLEISLKEKEILLKEIHHRVKNNLQVISSLLNLQSRTISDSHTLEIFNESQNRIKSMALIHEKLYQSQNFAKINFGEYVDDLLKNLFESYLYRNSRVKKTIKIENIHLNIDIAVVIGLIINELVSNALKHAFRVRNNNMPEDDEIIVKMENNENKFLLSVKDNGRGFPGNINFRDTSSLGLQLVNTLIEQIDGYINMNKGNGTEFVVTFSSYR